MTNSERANKIFEERNWGFRILYDTILDITTNDSEEEVYGIITRNLKKMCKAEISGIISVDKDKDEGYMKSFVDKDDNTSFFYKNDSDERVNIPKCVVENLLNIKIGETVPEYKELLFVFPEGKKCFKKETEHMNVYYFKLSKYSDGEDIGFVCIDKRNKLKLKDIIETYVNMTSIILQRLKGNQELVDMNNKFSTLLESSPVGIMLVNDKKRIVEANSALLNLMRINDKESLVGPCYEIFCNNENRLCEKLCEKCISLENENVVVTSDGCEIPVLHCVNRITINDSMYFLETIVDISEIKRMEEEKKILTKKLFQMQKLDSLMTLASGVAHEINTPIQSLKNDISFVMKAYSKVGNMIDDYKDIISRCISDEGLVDKIHKEIDLLERKNRYSRMGNMFSCAVTDMQDNLTHISDIVNYVKDFSRMDEVEMREEDINEMVRKFVKIYSHELEGKIEIKIATDEDLPYVNCVPSLIKEAIFELLNNAVDAFSSFEKSDREAIIVIETYRKEGHVGISISDNGIGIESEIQDRVFDPFYTTKEVGMGTGQGLTNVFHVVVEKHNGQVYFDSSLGVGSKFFIELPI